MGIGMNNGDVVSLTTYRKNMVYNPIAEVEAYWEALRGVRVVPLRSEIDPRGIERALDNTFLLEKIAPGLARFRLAGRVLNDLVGMEVRGMPLTAMGTPAARETMRDCLNDLFEGPCSVQMHLHAPGGFGKGALEGELLMLPLKSDLGDISRAIGCLKVNGKIGRAPRRFEIVNITMNELGPFKTDQPDPAPTPNPGFAETQKAFKPKPRRSAAHLKLVKTDTGDQDI